MRGVDQALTPLVQRQPGPVRVGEAFVWRELITGEEPDLAAATDVARVLLS